MGDDHREGEGEEHCERVWEAEEGRKREEEGGEGRNGGERGREEGGGRRRGREARGEKRERWWRAIVVCGGGVMGEEKRDGFIYLFIVVHLRCVVFFELFLKLILEFITVDLKDIKKLWNPIMLIIKEIIS